MEEVTGIFNGHELIGDDGYSYPVPANYASKSHLVEGDKLTMRFEDGQFKFKQVDLVKRVQKIGLYVGDGVVNIDGKAYKILRSSITYFAPDYGEKLMVELPADGEAEYAAVVSVIRKVKHD